MSNVDIARAWKDAEYRQSLSAEEQALLPAHPAGTIDLADEDLRQAAGGENLSLFGACTYFNCVTNEVTCGDFCRPPLTQ